MFIISHVSLIPLLKLKTNTKISNGPEHGKCSCFTTDSTGNSMSLKPAPLGFSSFQSLPGSPHLNQLILPHFPLCSQHYGKVQYEAEDWLWIQSLDLFMKENEDGNKIMGPQLQFPKAWKHLRLGELTKQSMFSVKLPPLLFFPFKI